MKFHIENHYTFQYPTQLFIFLKNNIIFSVQIFENLLRYMDIFSLKFKYLSLFICRYIFGIAHILKSWISILSIEKNIFGKNFPLLIFRCLSNICVSGATMFQYYIKIVPTQYSNKKGEVINSNQFSVTKHKKVISIMNGESGMPGIFFQYELSPLMVKYTEHERSFGHFLTNVCAIIGGIFTVAGLLDSFFFHTSRLIQKKFELGKLH